jgi:hypothetical protein
MVYRGVERRAGVSYHTTAHVLDRLLDENYDQAVRREFQPEKSRALPQVSQTAEGLVYADDFESYSDPHAFKLEPRWGFAYHRQSLLDLNADLVEGQGRSGSHAALVAGLAEINCVAYGLRHHFPAPLTDGRVRFFIRRRPAEINDEPLSPDAPTDSRESSFLNPRRACCVRFTAAGEWRPAGFLFATGDWGQETFVTDFRVDRRGRVAFSKDGWHEVTVDCRPGRPAELRVDGQPLAALESEAIDEIGFRPFMKGRAFYVDDVEILYRGDAKRLLAEHCARRPKTPRSVAPFTEAEAAFLTGGHRGVLAGKFQAALPEKAIPRADVRSGSRLFIHLDHPLETDELVLDDLLHPGTVVHVKDKYKGKIIYVTRAHKGDHCGEGHMRKRSGMRSQAIFNRTSKLAREYREKGVVIIGVAAVESGHRNTPTSFEARVATAFENMWLTRALMAEGGLTINDVIFGCDPTVYDEILGERLTNHMRLWNQTPSKAPIEGQFAGMGPDAIIDRQGRTVFRGAGPDGQGYWTQRMVLDRLLDETFDAACRQEFRNPDLPHYKNPLLPKQEKRPEGLAYRDDFESYADTYDFGLQPRWGFSHQNVPAEDTPAVFAAEGRNGSSAIFLNAMHNADLLSSNLSKGFCAHEFPVPLRDGHFLFHVRRGPHVKFSGMPPLFRIAVTCIAPNGNAAGPHARPGQAYFGAGGDGESPATLTTLGEWGKETFGLAPSLNVLRWRTKYEDEVNASNFRDSGIAMAENAWQEIRIVCAPGRNVRILIDGKPAGELNIDSIRAVQFRSETWSGTWVDDVELFYRGDAGKIKKEHAEAVRKDFQRRYAEWRKEADEARRE